MKQEKFNHRVSISKCNFLLFDFELVSYSKRNFLFLNFELVTRSETFYFSTSG